MINRFAANLTMLYQEVPFLDRFGKAAEAGFSAVEFLFPYQYDIDAIANNIEDYGLNLVLFNLHPGNINRGEWGTLSNPHKNEYFRRSFNDGLAIARKLECASINMMFGQKLRGTSSEDQVECALKNLQWAASQAAQENITLLIEPLNTFDFPNYFLSTTKQALDIIDLVNKSNVSLQYDIYHSQMSEENLINTLTQHMNQIGHIQIADVPGRHQPGTGEIRFEPIFSTLEMLEYGGFVGLEYVPVTTTEESLVWLREIW
jgi:hydroxypyruvate isomerase